MCVYLCLYSNPCYQKLNILKILFCSGALVFANKKRFLQRIYKVLIWLNLYKNINVRSRIRKSINSTFPEHIQIYYLEFKVWVLVTYFFCKGGFTPAHVGQSYKYFEVLLRSSSWNWHLIETSINILFDLKKEHHQTTFSLRKDLLNNIITW